MFCVNVVFNVVLLGFRDKGFGGLKLLIFGYRGFYFGVNVVLLGLRDTGIGGYR